MANRFELLASVGLAFTLGFGLLHAQPAGAEGRGGDVPQGQGETPAAFPVLNEPKSLAGMDLDFTHGAKLSEVLQNLSKQSGVSIILHTSVTGHELSTSADLRGMNFQKVLDSLMLQNDLFYKVMDPTSIMVFKKTPQNLQEFENKQIKTFYLANAEVETVRATFNALMPQLRVFTERRLSAVTITGSASELAKAQQIVNNLDRGRGEVMLQMELVEVPQAASVSAGLLGRIDTPPSPDAKRVAPDKALAKVMQEGGSKLMASPNVRVVAGETAEVRIGRKPVPSQEDSGTRPTQTASAPKSETSRPASKAEDLGLWIKVRPRLHPDHEITLDLEYEITDPLKADAPGHPAHSERGIKTSMRLKEGETIVLGGLLEEDKHSGASESTHGGKDKKDRLLVIKASVVRLGDQ